MRKILLILFLAVGFVLTTNAQSKQIVKFPTGKESVKLKSSVVGDKYVDFVVNVNTNQVLTATVLTKKVAFVIIEPDGEPMADSYGIRDIATQVDVSGIYKIRVMKEDTSSKKKNTRTDFSIFIKVENMK